jgi:hypothetical protein
MSRLREAARNNLPTFLALPFDRLRERSLGKLFPGGSLKWIVSKHHDIALERQTQFVSRAIRFRRDKNLPGFRNLEGLA